MQLGLILFVLKRRALLIPLNFYYSFASYEISFESKALPILCLQLSKMTISCIIDQDYIINSKINGCRTVKRFL